MAGNVEHFCTSSRSDINERDFRGYTALMYAVRNNRLQYVELLLKYRPNIAIRTTMGVTAMTIAARSGFLECLKMLVGVGNAKHMNECSDLVDMASFDLDLGIGQECMGSTTHCQCTSKHRVTGFPLKNASPLIYAAQLNRIECAKYLLKSGANINICEDEYMVPIRCYNIRKLLFVAGDARISQQAEFRADNLQSFCREKIRAHLLAMNRIENLFVQASKLALPDILAQYIVFGLSLE